MEKQPRKVRRPFGTSSRAQHVRCLLHLPGHFSRRQTANYVHWTQQRMLCKHLLFRLVSSALAPRGKNTHRLGGIIPIQLTLGKQKQPNRAMGEGSFFDADLGM